MRHLAIHQNEVVRAPLILVDLLYIINNLVECLFATQRMLYMQVNIQLKRFQNHFHRQNIVLLVVHNQYFIWLYCLQKSTCVTEFVAIFTFWTIKAAFFNVFDVEIVNLRVILFVLIVLFENWRNITFFNLLDILNSLG